MVTRNVEKMEDNNPNGNNIWGWIVVIGTGTAGEITRKLLRSKHQKDLQKRVDDSQLSPCDFKVSSDDSIIPIYVVGKDEVDLSKFEEVTINGDEAEEWKSFISTLGGETFKTGLTASAFNGLLKCDVPLKDLYRIKDNPDAMRGFVMKDGKFDKQARFSKASISNVAPLMIYQCMAAVTSQYYQHIISERLSEIDYKLDNLIQVLNAEDRAKLKVAYRHFVELSTKESYDIADKIIVSEFSNWVEIIRDKNIELLDRITIQDLHVDYKWTDKLEAEAKIQKLNQTHYFERLEMVMRAEYLAYIASVVSVIIAKKLGNNEDVTIYAKRIKLDYWNNYLNKFQKIRHDIIKYIDLESESSWLQGDEIKKMRDEQEKIFSCWEKRMVDMHNNLDYKVTQYLQVKEDGSVKKYISLKKE